jgi:hypothetical protein
MHASQRFTEQVQDIKASVPAILAHWGLCSQFSRWRLTQDPQTGLVVLFGVLNNFAVAAPASAPFDAYFDPGVLLDLATSLNVLVVPSGNEGLRYAFILDRGQFSPLPAAVDSLSPERSPVLMDTLASPIVPTQGEAEVEQQRVLYRPRARIPKSLNAPSAVPLVKGGAEPLPHSLLITTEHRSTRIN